jgi:hypothetical protein
VALTDGRHHSSIPSPGNWSVVVMDNCSIHHNEEIHRLIVDECGRHLLLFRRSNLMLIYVK